MADERTSSDEPTHEHDPEHVPGHDLDPQDAPDAAPDETGHDAAGADDPESPELDAGADAVEAPALVVTSWPLIGLVSDAETGEPLAGAHLAVRDTDSHLVAQATTAADGTFPLDELAPGAYAAAVVADGYAVATRALVVGGETPVDVQFALTRKRSRKVPFAVAALAALVAAVLSVLVLLTDPPVEDGVVPSLVGLDIAAATSELTAAGFTLGQVAEVVDEAPAGTVLSQSLPAGTAAAPGSLVDVTASTGVDEQATVEVPDVLGLDEQEAITALTAAGLELAGVETVDAADLPGGVVAATDPAPGSLVDPGAPVTLTVTAEPDAEPEQTLTEVPDVLGADLDDALATLEASGFGVLIETIADDDDADGTVIEQLPAAGEVAAEGDTVTLFVAGEAPDDDATADANGDDEDAAPVDE